MPSGASSWATWLRSSSGRERSRALANSFRCACRPAHARSRPVRANRRSGRYGPMTTCTIRASLWWKTPSSIAPAPCAATPCISTSSITPATWCRRRRRVAGCNPRPTIPELGFCLGSRAQQFWLDEGHPASLAPGKRPRTTLTPTMALRDGEPYLAWGSPGGDQQDQWTAQFFLRHVHAKMNLQEAIDAPAWHSEHFPASFWPREARPGVLVVEGRLSADDDQGIAPPRPQGRGGRRLVGRPADGGLARRQPPPRGRQSARHARLRRRTLTISAAAAPRPRARRPPWS